MRSGYDIPEKHKSRLYPAVLELFSKRDFHQVDMRTISKNSGVSIATIYQYFPSKEALLFSILSEYLEELVDLIARHLQGLDSSKEIFRKVFWLTMDFYDNRPGVAVTMFITVPTRTWMQEDAYKIGNELMDEIIGAALERGDIDPRIDSRRFKDIFYMISYRIIMSWYYFGMKWKLVDAVEKDFEIFWKLLAPESPEDDTRKQLDI
ncbi:MAG: TetR/AcrR family transcriptional regulator [Desulfomonilaceae bacterium]|nr:TetR/AcrR family transcriptional regulator [Desulfomonilaceae bacterium]